LKSNHTINCMIIWKANFLIKKWYFRIDTFFFEFLFLTMWRLKVVPFPSKNIKRLSVFAISKLFQWIEDSLFG